MSQAAVELDLGPVLLDCTPAEIATVFAGLLREIRIAVPRLSGADRHALRLIMARPNRALTVAELFPGFERDSDAHATLRRLRTAQFLRPFGPDKWHRDARIETKPFARLLWERLGEHALFGDATPDAGPRPARAEREPHEGRAAPHDDPDASAVGEATVDDGSDLFPTLGARECATDDVITAITYGARGRAKG